MSERLDERCVDPDLGRGADQRRDRTTGIRLGDCGEERLVVDSTITARGFVPGADREGFAKAVAAADEGCPFSTLIKASATVTIDATLEEE